VATQSNEQSSRHYFLFTPEQSLI